MDDHNSADRGSGGSAESSARNAQTGAPYTERNSEKDDGAWLIDEEEISDNVHRIVENAVYHRRAGIAGSPYDSAADKQEHVEYVDRTGDPEIIDGVLADGSICTHPAGEKGCDEKLDQKGDDQSEPDHCQKGLAHDFLCFCEIAVSDGSGN